MPSLATESLLRVTTPIANAVVFPFAALSRVSLNDLQQSVDYRRASDLVPPLGPELTNSLMAQAIENGGPFLMARFGSTELRVVLRHHGRNARTSLEKFYALLTQFEFPWWASWEHVNIQKKSGFYPVTEQTVDRFVELMKASMADLDLLASWVPGENKLSHHFTKSKVTTLEHFNQLRRADLWTKKLKDKRVLVVHPFENSIHSQYEKRHLLHEDPEMLPDFDLKIIKAVQSLGTPPPEFPTWFDGLDFMHAESRKVDYDVALIAAGAYSLPLAARLKSEGKTALVLGGILQLLFGIMGKRWDSSGLYNDHWTRPLDTERPDGYKGADGGAYW